MLNTTKENLLMSLIARVSTGPSVTRWTPGFSKLVDRCARTSADRLGPQIVQMEEWLVPPKFENTCNQAQLDLLSLWECALKFSNERNIQQLHREVALGLIILIMQRDDFSLNQDATEDVRKWYNKMLLLTFDRATILLKFNSKSVGEVQFAGNALAVFFFRLPLVSTMVVDSLQSKTMEIRQSNGFFVAPPKQQGESRFKNRRRSSLKLFKDGEEDAGGEDHQTVRVHHESTSSVSPLQKSSSVPSPTNGAASSLDGNNATPKVLAPSSPVTSSPSMLRKLTEEWNSSDKLFVDSNPDLFLWNASLTDTSHTSLVFNHVLDATTHWSKWLSTKESFFLSFVEMFVAHIQRCCTSSAARRGIGTTTPQDLDQCLGAIRWKLVPGYDLILSCFFPLLRSAIWWDSIARRTAGQGAGWVTSLQGYMRVKRTATALLSADHSLLPAFCQCAFECTNLHSLLSVDSGIEHLNLFFATAAMIRKPSADAYTAAPRGIATTSTQKNESLPDSFDYDAFWVCFNKMLESESYQVLLKCCSFLYNNLHRFFGRNRTRIVNDLLCPKMFFRLFLHWSPEVRTCFQHLVVYKVLRADRRYLPCFSDSQVMLLYGTNASATSSSSKKKQPPKTPVTSPRVAVSAKAAWGKQDEIQQVAASPPSSPASPNKQQLQASSPPVSPTSTNSTTSIPIPPSSPNASMNPQDAPATADEIAQLTRSAQRRLSLFDRANAVDDEELWSDMAFSSKIDSFVRMCLSFRDKDGGGVPAELAVYVEPALEQYSLLLIRYYRGATLASLDEIPDTLSHRMMLSEFTESM